MCSVSEEENKKWLSVLQNWKEKEKSDALSLLFSTKSSPSVIEEYNIQLPELKGYLVELSRWLMQCGVTAAFKQMPMTGRLVSQLCKLSILHLHSCLSMEVINCVIALSSLLDAEKCDNPSNASKRAQAWSIEHFSKMAFAPAHGLDLFIMEEFGVSQKEYLTEHIKQIGKTIFEFYKATDWSNAETLAVKRDLLAAFEAVEKATQDAEGCKRDFLKLKVIRDMYLDLLDDLFTNEFSAFEDYVVSIVVRCVQMFPASDEEIADDCIVATKLLPLCRRHEKYFLAAMNVLTGLQTTDDGNAAVVCLSVNLSRLYENT